MIIAHLSDTHVGAGDPSARYGRCWPISPRCSRSRTWSSSPATSSTTAGRARYDEAARVLGEWRGAAPMLLCPATTTDARVCRARGLPEDRR
jgi:hypothetical protein